MCRLRTLFLVLGLVLLTGTLRADVVLHPGTVTGTLGLSNWNFSNASIWVGGNPNGFTGSQYISVTQNQSTYSITVEGGETYTSLSATLYSHSPVYTRFSRWINTSFTVPVGGSVVQNLYAAGTSIAVSATATGATITAISAQASGGGGSAWWSSDRGASGASVNLPAIPTVPGDNPITVSADVSMTLIDSTGRSCTQSRHFTQSIASLSESGGAVTQPFDMTGVSCPLPETGNLAGTVELRGLSAPLSQLQIYFSGPDYRSAQFATNPATYDLRGLRVGWYYTSASAQFAAPYASTLYIPNGGQYFTLVESGKTTTRNFVFDTATVSGNVSFTGPLATQPFNRYLYFNPDYSSGVPSNYGGGVSVVSPPGAGGPYGAVLTPGPWKGSFSANRYTTAGSISFSTTNGSILNATAGAQLIADRVIDSSEADLVFDVIEPPGQTVLISWPSASFSGYDPTTGWSAYISASSNEQNAATPALHIVGSPGHYRFDAYATVQGSSTKFVSSTIDLGLAANTPAGTDVPVTLLDAAGNSLDVDLIFSNVSTAGSTTGSTTNVGPAPPGSFTIVPGFNGASYLSINTTASFSGPVKIAIQYSLAELGITPAQEPFLQLWHYKCTPAPCTWEMINDSFVVPNPNTGTHTIYGATNGFSLFALMLPPVHAPIMSCVGTADAPKIVATSAGVCTAVVDNTNGIAGTCSDDGGGLVSCTFDGQPSQTLVPGSHTVTLKGMVNGGSSAECTSYVSVVDMEAPAIFCPGAQTIECSGPSTLLPLSATVSDNCSAGSPSCSESFALGRNTASCSVSDSAGNTSSCSTVVTVVDTTAPSLSVSVSPSVLWPPNHKLVPITISTTVNDRCDPKPVVTCSATSSQPENGTGDGDTAADIVWSQGRLLLRAERAGHSGDRLYTIACTATDGSGNATSGTAFVTVPHDQR